MKRGDDLHSLIGEVRKNLHCSSRLSAEQCEHLLNSIQKFACIDFSVFFDGMSHSEMTLAYCAQGYEEQYGNAITVNEAAAALHISVPAVSRTLRGLSECGILERRSDENDRRSVRIHVTDKGRELLAKNIANCIEAVDSSMKPFSEEELAAMISLHAKFTAALSKYAAQYGHTTEKAYKRKEL